MTGATLRLEMGSPSRRIGSGLVLAGGLAASVVVGAVAANADYARIVTAGALFFCLAAIAARQPRVALYGLIGWLGVAGLVRRLATAIGVETGSIGDPLLLVGPLLILVLFGIAVERGAFRNMTTFSKLVLAFTVVLAISCLNPLQGGPSVGLGGVVLVIVPMLSFWVGRTLIDERAVTVIAYILAGLSVAAALYGLNQLLNAFPSWDQSWIEHSGYASLAVAGATRAFGFSASAQEYGSLLGIGILAWRALGSRVGWMVPATVAVALLGVAIWLASGRGVFVLTLAALWLTFSATQDRSFKFAIVGGLVMLALLPTVVGAVVSPSRGEQISTTSSLTSHQAEGLGNPFGENSTFGVHLEEVGSAITNTVSNPLGRGLGATTHAAAKFGGNVEKAEADPGNAPIAAGFIGLVLYLLVAAYGLKYAYDVARRRRSVGAIAALGIIVVSLLHWLTGGQYAVILLCWLLLGWVDGAVADQRADEVAAVPLGLDPGE
jgi:hypothetical protein